MKFSQDLRRRHVFRVVGLYIVGVWLMIQVASTAFPAWDIPDSAIRYLIFAAVLGFPVAVVFGWLFDITADGIVRTPRASAKDEVDLRLKRTDYLILGALAVVSAVVLYNSYEQVRESAKDPPVRIQAAGNSIAVLPFKNLGGDASTEYFSNGVTEEILHRLSSFQSLRVLGQTSSFAFANTELTPAGISGILGVRYLLQGSVRQDQGQVRITAQLVDDTGYQIWSESFDRKLEGIFAIQTDIANSVAQKLVAHIAPQTLNAARQTLKIEAFQEYLVGRAFLNDRSPRWQENAIAAFKRAIAIDPDYAPPFAGLAVAVALEFGTGASDYSSTLVEARAQAKNALVLDPELAEAHAAQGFILLYQQQPDFVAAEAALRRAIKLDPAVVYAYNWLGIALTGQGKTEETNVVRETALKIDPLNPVLIANAAGHFQFIGDFRRAETLMLRLMDLPNPPELAYFGLHALYAEYGRFTDSLDWLKRFIRDFGDRTTPGTYYLLSRQYQLLGMPEAAEYWYQQDARRDPIPRRVVLVKATDLRLRGENEQLKSLTDEYFSRNPIDVEQMPGFVTETVGAIKIIIGDAAVGIALLERSFDAQQPITITSGTSIDDAHTLAYGYRMSGQDQKAEWLLEKLNQMLQTIEQRDRPRSPEFLEWQTLNRMMRGDISGAGTALEAAVDSGWRNYLPVIHDVRWKEAVSAPALASLLAFVKADIDRQRSRVESIEAESEFRAEFEKRAEDKTGGKK